MKRYFIHWGIILSIGWSTLAYAEPVDDGTQSAGDDVSIKSSAESFSSTDADSQENLVAAQGMSSHIAQQLMTQLPLAAQQQQLTQLQQDMSQLHQQLTQLLERLDDKPSATSSAKTGGILGGLAMTNPLWFSGVLLILTIVVAGWLLYRRWLVIGETDFTSVEDMLQDVSHDKVASQLDMAMTYFSLGQYLQASALVEQVIANGNDTQRMEARLLQQQIQQAVE
jgi:FimV-like protein